MILILILILKIILIFIKTFRGDTKLDGYLYYIKNNAFQWISSWNPNPDHDPDPKKKFWNSLQNKTEFHEYY